MSNRDLDDVIAVVESEAAGLAPTDYMHDELRFLRELKAMKAYVIELQEELRKCQQDAIAIQADNERLRELLRECRHFVKALCDHDDAACGCYQHIVLRGIDAALGEGKA